MKEKIVIILRNRTNGLSLSVCCTYIVNINQLFIYFLSWCRANAAYKENVFKLILFIYFLLPFFPQKIITQLGTLLPTAIVAKKKKKRTNNIYLLRCRSIAFFHA